MRPGDALDISGLPAHVYKKDGEAVMKPCAEVLMTVGEAEALMERRLIPLCSMKDSDRVHVAGFRSITGKAFAGRGEGCCGSRWLYEGNKPITILNPGDHRA